jgi:cytochrome bd ubiquinol oxidase subunit I
MDIVSLSQWQFAITTVYHFFFVPLTLGLSWLVAIMETIYVTTGDETYKRMVKFWGRLFLINFAMGVVTGIVQEFQFGMNWSEYSRYVGDIFGAPLAIEALLAFFLESTFLGVWIFGWEKLSKKMHMVTIWLVAIGSNLSALWILIANSFMQQPQGYVLQGGRALMNDFSAVVFNPNAWLEFPHVIFSGLTTAAFFVIGISAYHMLRNKQEKVFFNNSFRLGSIVAIAAIFLTILVGHTQAQHMVQTQPMKMAAAEALLTSEDPASFSLFSIVDMSTNKDILSVRLPAMLSLLSYNQLSGKVLGVNDLQAMYEKQYGPGNYIPPMIINYWSFRIMVGFGFLMLAIAIYLLVQVMRNKTLAHPKLIRLLPFVIAFPFISNSTGWILTEVGRQPWVVFGLLKTKDAVSPILTPGLVLTSLIGFTLVYGALMVADIYLLNKFAKRGPATVKQAAVKHGVGDESYWE